MTSAPPERVAIVAETDTVLSRLGFDGVVDLEEFAVVDDREGRYYDLGTGAGVRVIDGL